MTRLQTRLRDERGMTLVMVATGMIAFLSATMLAVDVGMLMVARTESQNAADAGALAGAVALAFDDLRRPHSHRSGCPQRDRGRHRGRQQRHERGGVGHRRRTSRFRQSTQVRVRVQRSSARGNPLSTFIAPMFGIDTVDIGAVATAEVSPANAMTCVKPFTVPDKWIERQTPPWDPDDTFDVVDKKGKPLAESRHLHPARSDGLHRLQRRDGSRSPDHPEGGHGHEHRAELLLSVFHRRRERRVGIPMEHRQLQHDGPWDSAIFCMAEPGNMVGPTTPGHGRADRPRSVGLLGHVQQQSRRRRCTRARASSPSRCSIPSTTRPASRTAATPTSRRSTTWGSSSKRCRATASSDASRLSAEC